MLFGFCIRLFESHLRNILMKYFYDYQNNF